MNKIIIKVVFLLSFISSVFSQSPVIPIVKENVLLGGVQDGKWLTAEQTFPKMKDESRFILLGHSAIEKGSPGIGRKAQFSSCSDLPDIEVTRNQKVLIAIGAEAKWDPLPRLAKRIPFADPTNQKIAAEFLKSRKITPSAQIEILQSMQVDLDGDGMMETLISAYYHENKDSLEIRSIGDYSFALLRKNVNGKPQNILIDGDFFTKGNLSGSTDVRLFGSVADLNGDGSLEIVLTIRHKYGYWDRVYQLNQNTPTKVLEAGCGV